MKILLFLALLAAAPAAAQGASAGAPAAPAERDPRPARMEARHPVSLLLQQREALGLSAEQVARLERIRTAFAARNRELWAVIQAPERMEREEEAAARRASAATPGRDRREAVHHARQAAREAEVALREAARAAAGEAFAVLTSDQRARAQSLGGG